mmetsp:Transcript_15769/g.33327  ORF Transcript_15769/g.33327 Transcript_15769/m.33327 type:complete len:200 (+) Transcript_15769:1998-2597(+)
MGTPPLPSSSVTLALLQILAVPNNAERALNSMDFSVTCRVVFRGLLVLPPPPPPLSLLPPESSRVNLFAEVITSFSVLTKYPPLFFMSYPTPVSPKHKLGNAKLYIDLAVISFCVSVPVLSLATTVAHPSVSTAVSFLTMALWRAMRSTPSARVTVTQMGSPSGMAATARLTATVTVSKKGRPRRYPTRAITAIPAEEE